MSDALLCSSRPGPNVALQQPTGSGLPHKDEAFKNELVTMLGGLQRGRIGDVWQDRRIEAGDDWYNSVHEAMKDCGLLLVQPGIPCISLHSGRPGVDRHSYCYRTACKGENPNVMTLTLRNIPQTRS